MQFDKVAVRDEMVRTDLLAVDYLGTPHARKFKVSSNVLVHQASDIEYRAATTHCETFLIFGRLARRLGVDTNDLKREKKKLSQLIQAISGFGRRCHSGISHSEQFLEDLDFFGIGVEVTLFCDQPGR